MVKAASSSTIRQLADRLRAEIPLKGVNLLWLRQHKGDVLALAKTWTVGRVAFLLGIPTVGLERWVRAMAIGEIITEAELNGGGPEGSEAAPGSVSPSTPAPMPELGLLAAPAMQAVDGGGRDRIGPGPRSGGQASSQATRVSAEDTAPGPGPTPSAAPVPGYGPPWMRHLEGMKADRQRLGDAAAADLWVSRGMPRQTFSRLLGLARERAGARPESPQDAPEGPLVAPAPIPPSRSPAPTPTKLAPADGGAVKGRGGRPQRWPREEISQDIATLGREAAQEKWTSKGMSRGFWYKIAARIPASSASGGQPPSPQERVGGPAKARRLSAEQDAFKVALCESFGIDPRSCYRLVVLLDASGPPRAKAYLFKFAVDGQIQEETRQAPFVKNALTSEMPDAPVS